MYSTMFSILLASAGMAAGDTPETAIPGVGFGGYGSYGSYGGYASYPGGRYPNRGWIVPYYFFYPAPGGDMGGSSVEARKERETLDKRFGELKTILGIYEQKIRGLEQKVDEQDKTADTQVRVLEILDRKLTDTLAKYQARTMEALDKKLSEAGERNQTKLVEKLTVVQETQIRKEIDSGIAEQVKALTTRLDDRLRTIEDRLQTAQIGNKEGSPTNLENGNQARTLENRIAAIEQQLKIGEQIKAGFDGLKGNIGGKNDPRVPRHTTGVPFNRGLIIVSLPADARLFLDGHPSVVGANLRTFISPELELNKNYFYTVRVEVDRGGKTLTETQRVYFQPGREVRISFEHLHAGIAAAQETKKTN